MAFDIHGGPGGVVNLPVVSPIYEVVMMLIHDYEEKIISEVMQKYEIPFSIQMVNGIGYILNTYEVKDLEYFDKIVNYLKQRSKRDIYGRYPNDPSFMKEHVVDWVFYLEQYVYYLKNVLTCCDWTERKKYMFPDDVYDVVYCFNKGKMAFEYLKENFSLD